MALTFGGEGKPEYLQIKQTLGLCCSWMIRGVREKSQGAKKRIVLTPNWYSVKVTFDLHFTVD